MLVRCSLIDKPLLFADTEDVLNVLRSVTDGWRFIATSESGEPSIRVSCNGNVFRIEEEGREAVYEDSAVSAACSLVAILLNRMVENDPERLCLHAGAVAMSGQTLVFPNTHRAGKSTLATALALRGARLVADDILPLDCSNGRIRSISSGVAPRLRLPLAPSLGCRFRLSAWRFAGPDDGYYRYIRLPHSSRAPLGERHNPSAFVFLERTAAGADHGCLNAVSKASAMRILLLQNFGTAAPTSAILERIDRLAESTPAFLLRYGDLGAAVSLLRSSFCGTLLARALWLRLDPAEPDLGRTDSVATSQREPLTSCDHAICHNEGVVLREAEGVVFLADGEYGAIFALDPLGAAIWKLLEEPTSVREAAALVSEAFPEIEPARIAADVIRLIQTLLARQLLRQVN
jgi:hypothetical protein